MQTTNELKDKINQLFEEVDKQSETTEVTDGEFSEPIEGEVIENPPKPGGISIKWLIPIGLISLAIALIAALVIVPFFAQSATIIINPDRKTIHITVKIDAATRKLFTKSLTLSQKITTTGRARQSASAAYGYVVLYNSLPDLQMIPAGTLLTGTDGVHVITDTDAYIPAGTLSVNGSVAVLAHTTITGAGSNIQAGDINGVCCRDYVFARNNAFSGGQDARDYAIPTTADIQRAVRDMSSLLQESMTIEAQAQLHIGEDALPPQCKTKSSSDTPVGKEAEQITVTLISTCTAYSFDKNTITQKALDNFSRAVANQMGARYIPDKIIQQQITNVKAQGDITTITINLSGSAIYRFSDNEIQQIKTLIAGKSRSEATSLMLKVKGVHTVGMQIAQNRTVLPDYRNITITVYQT